MKKHLIYFFAFLLAASCKNSSDDSTQNAGDTTGQYETIPDGTLADTGKTVEPALETTAPSAPPADKKSTPLPGKKETKNKKPKEQPKSDGVKEQPAGYEAAKIRDRSSLDGCGYMLLLTSGVFVDPINLPKEFHKDHLDVWVKYKAAPNRMSICMAGQIVEIIDIKKRAF